MTDAETIQRLLSILSSIAPDQVPGPFITQGFGTVGPDGLHEAYMICPVYGADVRCTAIYRREAIASG